MAELSQIQQTSIYNQVFPLQKPEYAQEVTEVSKKSFVAVLLVSSHGTNEESRLMIDIWRDLARQFGDIKFCQMQADLCIEGYPDRLTPTVLLYKDGDIKEQIVTLKDMNGLRTTSKGVYIKFLEPTIESKLIGRLRFHRHASANRRHQSRRHQNRAQWLSVQPQQRLPKKGEDWRIPPNSIMLPAIFSLQDHLYRLWLGRHLILLGKAGFRDSRAPSASKAASQGKFHGRGGLYQSTERRVWDYDNTEISVLIDCGVTI